MMRRGEWLKHFLAYLLVVLPEDAIAGRDSSGNDDAGRYRVAMVLDSGYRLKVEVFLEEDVSCSPVISHIENHPRRAQTSYMPNLWKTPEWMPIDTDTGTS